MFATYVIAFMVVLIIICLLLDVIFPDNNCETREIAKRELLIAKENIYAEIAKQNVREAGERTRKKIDEIAGI